MSRPIIEVSISTSILLPSKISNLIEYFFVESIILNAKATSFSFVKPLMRIVESVISMSFAELERVKTFLTGMSGLLSTGLSSIGSLSSLHVASSLGSSTGSSGLSTGSSGLSIGSSGVSGSVGLSGSLGFESSSF